MADLVRVSYSQSGSSKTTNAMGMRPMQARVYDARAAQLMGSTKGNATAPGTT